MTEHTPGPWIVDGTFRGQCRVRASDIGKYGGHAIAQVNAGRDECQANGRLIGAAPDFLSAATSHENPQLWRIEYLNALLRSLDEGALEQDRREDPKAFANMMQILHEMVRDTRAAIAKARNT